MLGGAGEADAACSALLILEAAYDRSETTPGALRRIAAAAAEAVPHGPITAGQFDTGARLDPARLVFTADSSDLDCTVSTKPPIGAGPVGTQGACRYVDSIIR